MPYSSNKILTGRPALPDEVDQTSVAQFCASCMETFCRQATLDDFVHFHMRFESGLRKYADEARQGNERSAGPLRAEAISILSEVVKRRRASDLEAGKDAPDAR
jgi:hypothetical protein